MNNDLISREALQEEHSKECIHNCYYCKHFKWNTNKACSYCDVIDNAPTVTPSLNLDNITEDDVEKFKMIWQRSTSKGLLVISEDRPHGEWIFEKANEEQTDGYICSVCKCSFHTKVPYFSEFNFCPNCGAQMDKERERMKNEFLLTFEGGLPKGTNQEKRFNSRTGHFYKDKKLSALEQTFAYALRPHRPKEPSEQPIRLNLWFVFSITSPKRLWGTWKVTKPDVDNYPKAFIDQMVKEGFFKDDSFIVDLRVRKTYGEKASIFVQWEELGERP